MTDHQWSSFYDFATWVIFEIESEKKGYKKKHEDLQRAIDDEVEPVGPVPATSATDAHPAAEGLAGFCT